MDVSKFTKLKNHLDKKKKESVFVIFHVSFYFPRNQNGVKGRLKNVTLSFKCYF